MLMQFDPLDRQKKMKFRKSVYFKFENQYKKLPYLGRYSDTIRTVQSWTCELGYGADTMFHRAYFLFQLKRLSIEVAQTTLTPF